MDSKEPNMNKQVVLKPWQVDKTSQTCSAILNQFVEAITSFILSSAWNMSCCHLVETVSPIDLTASLL